MGMRTFLAPVMPAASVAIYAFAQTPTAATEVHEIQMTATFEFKCSAFCGLGRRKMKGKLIVEGQWIVNSGQ
jgi:heme/copper-type cytochrome/quinol oxidase subunit 2